MGPGVFRGSGGILSGGQLLPDWVSGTCPLSSGGQWAAAPPPPSTRGEAGILGPLSGQAESLLDVCYLQCPLLERERGRSRVGTEAGAGEGIEGVSCTSQSTKLRVTLLAAGFILGPNGASVHQLEKVCNIKIISRNLPRDLQCVRPTREFTLTGSQEAQSMAVAMFQCAIYAYKVLTEGTYRGKKVTRLQLIGDVIFRYKRPPRSKAPHAAQLDYDPMEFALIGEPERTPEARSELLLLRRRISQRDESLMWMRLDHLCGNHVCKACPAGHCMGCQRCGGHRCKCGASRVRPSVWPLR